MTSQINTPSHPEKDCLRQPLTAFQVAGWQAPEAPRSFTASSWALGQHWETQPHLISLLEEGCVPLRCRQCSSDKQNEKIDPLWLRFLNLWKGLFCECYKKWNVWRGLLAATWKGRSGIPGGKSSLCLRLGAGRQMLFFCFYFWDPLDYPGSISLWQLLQPCRDIWILDWLNIVGHWKWYIADYTQKEISNTADSYRIATDVESIITTTG